MNKTFNTGFLPHQFSHIIRYGWKSLCVQQFWTVFSLSSFLLQVGFYFSCFHLHRVSVMVVSLLFPDILKLKGCWDSALAVCYPLHTPPSDPVLASNLFSVHISIKTQFLSPSTALYELHARVIWTLSCLVSTLVIRGKVNAVILLPVLRWWNDSDVELSFPVEEALYNYVFHGSPLFRTAVFYSEANEAFTCLLNFTCQWSPYRRIVWITRLKPGDMGQVVKPLHPLT